MEQLAPCRECSGTGEVQVEVLYRGHSLDWVRLVWETCDICGGTGNAPRFAPGDRVIDPLDNVGVIRRVDRRRADVEYADVSFVWWQLDELRLVGNTDKGEG